MPLLGFPKEYQDAFALPMGCFMPSYPTAGAVGLQPPSTQGLTSELSSVRPPRVEGPKRRRTNGRSKVLSNKVQAFYENTDDVSAPEAARTMPRADEFEAAVRAADSNPRPAPLSIVVGSSTLPVKLSNIAPSPATPELLGALEMLEDNIMGTA